MRIFVWNMTIFCLFHSMRAENDVIESSVKVKKVIFKCRFTFVSKDGIVNTEQSKIACSPRKPKRKKVTNFELKGKLGNYKLSFTINPNKITKVILETSNVSLSVPETCSAGYTHICPTSTDGSCPSQLSRSCPNSPPISTIEPFNCTCLPTRAVERDLGDGISPLGSCYRGCVCVPSHLLHGQCSEEPTSLLITGGRLDSVNYAITEVVAKSNCSVPDLPDTRNAHVTFVTYDGTVLTCGGLRNGRQDSSCIKLDLASSSWTSHSTLSKSRVWASSVVMPSGTYILGGGNGFGLDDTSEFLATTDTTWTSGPSLPFKSHQSCSVAISDDKFLLISANHVHEFDTMLQSWSAWPDLEQSRILHSCAKIGNKVIVAGGVTGVWNGTYLSSTEVIDIGTKIIHAGGPLNEARGFFGMATVSWSVASGEQKTVAFGGIKSVGSPSTITNYDSIEIWDDANETWEIDLITLNKKNHNFGYTGIQMVCSPE